MKRIAPDRRFPSAGCRAHPGGVDVDTAVRTRRTRRTFDPTRPVDRETLRQLLDLALRAPSAGQSQGREFLVLDDPDGRARFWSVTADDPDDAWFRRLQTAPALIVCWADREAYLDRYAERDKGWTDRAESRWPVPYWDVDTGMSAMILLLAAQARELGACFFGVPGERWDALRAAFAVPSRLRPVGVVALGSPVPGPRSPSLRRGRRRVEDVVSWGTYGRQAPDDPVRPT
jgi:nitroreductase